VTEEAAKDGKTVDVWAADPISSRTPEEIVHSVAPGAHVRTDVLVHREWAPGIGPGWVDRPRAEAEEIVAALAAEYGGAVDEQRLDGNCVALRLQNGDKRYIVFFYEEAVAEGQ
jgi:hypothetical protein